MRFVKEQEKVFEIFSGGGAFPPAKAKNSGYGKISSFEAGRQECGPKAGARLRNAEIAPTPNPLKTEGIASDRNRRAPARQAKRPPPEDRKIPPKPLSFCHRYS
jgi:hypothetical protein